MSKKELKAVIVTSLKKNPAAVVQALYILQGKEYGRGFSRKDKELGYWLLQTVVVQGITAGRPHNLLLRGNALKMARTIVIKYAGGQLLKAAQDKQELLNRQEQQYQ